MPVYQYQGLHYDLDETDPAKAKEKILAHLGSTGTSAPTTTKEEPLPESKPFYEEGYLGRVAKVAGEKVSELFTSAKDVAAHEKYYPKEKEVEQSTPGIGESLSAMGKQLVAHPVDSAIGLVKGLAADPELLFPSLWSAAPARLAAAIEKAGTVAKVAATTARGGAIGGVAEAGAGAVEGNLNPQQTANTAVLFALMGGGTHGAIEGVKQLGKVMPKDIIKDIEPPKEVDPAYAASKMREEESVSDVLARKKETEKTKTDLDTQQTADLDAGQAKETSKQPLARTDAEGEIHLNNKAIEEDFHSGFNYIFNPDSPTGAQKAEVFKQLGLTKEKFSEIVRTPEDYKAFIKAHEESHVANKDHAAYPRTPEGKADLSHPDAITIEVRATEDGLKAVKDKVHPDQALAAVKQDIQKAVVKDTEGHELALREAADVVSASANEILAANRRAEVFAHTIKKLIPEEKIRGRTTRAMESEKEYDKIYTDKEKATKLDEMATSLEKMDSYIEKGQVPKWFKGTLAEYQAKRDAYAHVIESWKALPSEGHAIPVMKMIDAHLKDIGEQAKAAGLIDELRNNYITHVLDFSKTKMTPKEIQSFLDKIYNTPKDSKLHKDFTQARKYEFLRELEKAVEGTGIVVHTDVATIVEAYDKAMLTAIIHDKMIRHFKEVLTPEGKGFLVPVSTEALKEGYVAFQGKGAKPLEGLLVHPDLVDTMGFMFREKNPSMILRALGGMSHLTKALNTVGSLFHMKSLFEAGSLTDPKLMMSEIGKEVLYKVFKSGEGSGARQAAKAFKEGGNDVLTDLYLQNGLTIAIEDVQQTIVADTGKYLDMVASKVAPKGKELKLFQQITDPLDKVVLQRLNKWTWEYAHAGQKLNVAFHLHQKMLLKNPEMSEAAIAKEVSMYVNNTFGGLNWLEVAKSVNNKYARAAAMKMAGIQGREWAQIVLFAPDWTVSTLRAFTSALPKELIKPQHWELRNGVKGLINPKTQGDLARRYVISTAIAYTTIINGINIAISGKPIWENDDPTRIAFTDGTSMQAAKHSMEAIHWMMAPDKTLGNKLGFFPKALFVSTTAVAYPSPTAPKLKDTSMIGRTKAIATLAAPFPFSSALQAPEGEGTKRAISSMLGVPIYGVGKEDLKKSIAKGKKEAAEKRRLKKLEEHR